MDKIIIFLCLVLSGCCSVSGPCQTVNKTASAVVSIDQNEIDNMIAVFSEAIKNNPNYSGFYYNRAALYFYKKDYNRSWEDIHKAEALGINLNLSIELVNKLKKASGREK